MYSVDKQLQSLNTIVVVTLYFIIKRSSTKLVVSLLTFTGSKKLTVFVCLTKNHVRVKIITDFLEAFIVCKV